MKKNAAHLIIFLSTIFLLGFTLSACSRFQKQNTSSKRTEITVTYTLKHDQHPFAHQKVHLNRQTKVLNGLKKSWPVKINKGFVTSIDHHQQQADKKIYWTYTINGRFATKGVIQQVVHNHDQIQFNLGKIKG